MLGNEKREWANERNSPCSSCKPCATCCERRQSMWQASTWAIHVLSVDELGGLALVIERRQLHGCSPHTSLVSHTVRLPYLALRHHSLSLQRRLKCWIPRRRGCQQHKLPFVLYNCKSWFSGVDRLLESRSNRSWWLRLNRGLGLLWNFYRIWNWGWSCLFWWKMLCRLGLIFVWWWKHSF